MTSALFISMKKLKGHEIIKSAAKHNHRELLAEVGANSKGRIDPNKTHLNYVLQGPEKAVEVAELRQTLLKKAGITRIRKDAVQGLELVFSLPPAAMIDHRPYFEEATEWAKSYFGVPLLSSVVHLDEAAPHCHVLLLPLVGGRLNGSAMMGNSTKLQIIQSEFHLQVAQRYGLERQASKKRLSGAAKREAAGSALNAILENPSLLNEPNVHQALIEAISQNPESLLLALGLTMPSPKAKRKTFVGIMTKPVKPEKAMGFSQKKPIGYSDVETNTQCQTLSCVCFGQATVSNAIKNDVQADAAEAGSDDREVDALISASLKGAKPLVKTPRNEHAPRADGSISSGVISSGNYPSKARQVFAHFGTATNRSPLSSASLRVSGRRIRPSKRDPPSR